MTFTAKTCASDRKAFNKVHSDLPATYGWKHKKVKISDHIVDNKLILKDGNEVQIVKEMKYLGQKLSFDY